MGTPGMKSLRIVMLGALMLTGPFRGVATAQELAYTAAPTPDREMAPHGYRLDVATGARSEWTPATGGATSPTWSPDGERLAYCGGMGVGFGLFVTGPRGAAPERIVDGMTASDVTWSPDGEWLAFTGLSRHSEPGLFLIHPDGRGLRRVAAGARPTWSPDGRRLAFYSTTTTPLAVLVQDLDSGRTVRVASFGAFPLPWADLAFADDGDHLYYTKTFDTGAGSFSGQVHRVRLRDGRDEPITEGHGARLLGIAPDGRTLAFLRAGDPRGHDAALTLFDVDTGIERPLLADAGGETGLTVLAGRTVANFGWSPDGTLLAFDLSVEATGGGRSGIFLADVARGLVAPALGSGVVYGTSLAWRP